MHSFVQICNEFSFKIVSDDSNVTQESRYLLYITCAESSNQKIFNNFNEALIATRVEIFNLICLLTSASLNNKNIFNLLRDEGLDILYSHK